MILEQRIRGQRLDSPNPILGQRPKLDLNICVITIFQCQYFFPIIRNKQFSSLQSVKLQDQEISTIAIKQFTTLFVLRPFL